MRKNVVQGGRSGGPDEPCLDALTRLRRKLEAEGKSFQDMIEEHLEKTKNDPPPAQGNIKKPL
jgi:hypothetical protein